MIRGCSDEKVEICSEELKGSSEIFKVCFCKGDKCNNDDKPFSNSNEMQIFSFTIIILMLFYYVIL